MYLGELKLTTYYHYLFYRLCSNTRLILLYSGRFRFRIIHSEDCVGTHILMCCSEDITGSASARKDRK